MKRTIKIAVAAAMALSATSAFATNGANLTGLGAKARGMGGVGIGMSHGAESALVNPALISTVKGNEISFGGTIFMPNVETDGGSAGAMYSKSAADMNVIPEVSLATEVNENFHWGIGMWGTAGMGVDYRDSTNPGAMNMVTNLQLMQFGVPLVYSNSGLSIGVSPILQYGSLDMDFNADMNPQDGTPEHYGFGVSQDLAFGYNVGISYVTDGLTLGATYANKIDMKYKGQYVEDLSTPAVYGVGASYKFGESTIALDYKKIKWSDANGFKDFGWEDQSVYAIGYEYATKGWALRAGYNHASSPIKEAALGATPQSMAQATMLNMFNLVGFPATTESHVSVGGSYNVSKSTSLDLAYVQALEADDTFDVMTSGGPSTINTTHSQKGVSVQLNYNF